MQLVTFSAATALLQLSSVVCFPKSLLSLRLEKTLGGGQVHNIGVDGGGPSHPPHLSWMFWEVCPRPPSLLAPLEEKQEALKWGGILPGSWPQGLLLLLLFNADGSPWTACDPCVGPLEG